MPVSLPVDSNLAMDTLNQNELVRKKIEMDSLRKRLGDNKSEDQRLRESCEGFESVFLQKMWEQMRKNVPKEGYLHSKDEDTYQSMFDVELSKKMASAGGIGLADMLYEQLSQKVTSTARSTTPAGTPPLMPVKKAEASPTPDKPEQQGELTAENLYSDLPQDNQEFYAAMSEEAPAAAPADADAPAVASALTALRTELDAPVAVSGETQHAPAVENIQATPDETPPHIAMRTDQPIIAEEEAAAQTTASTAAVGKAEETPAKTTARSNLNTTSWQGNGPVSAKTKPFRSGYKNNSQTPQAAAGSTTASSSESAQVAAAAPSAPGQAQTTGVQQSDAAATANSQASLPVHWPHDGKIISHFGWEEGQKDAPRRWNSGVQIAAQPGDSVRAVLDGTVVYSGPREGYGNTVVLQHKDGYLSYYGNIAATSVAVGDKVQSGTDFAKVSTPPTASSNGENHASLHFEIKRGEMALNPEMAIKKLTASS